MFKNIKLHDDIKKIIFNYLYQCKHKDCIKLGEVNLKYDYFDLQTGFYCKECKNNYVEKREWCKASRYYHYHCHPD